MNRLFSRQDHGDPKAVVPVYFSFPDWVKSPEVFARAYFEKFMRHYVGFYTNRPELIRREVRVEKLTTIMKDAMGNRYDGKNFSG